MIERRYWNSEMESILGNEEMRALQLCRLRGRVAQIFEHAPYFRRCMQANGVEGPKDIRSLADWSRALPPFTKTDCRALMDECGSDVYRFLDQTLPVPLDQIVTMSATSGTTGEPPPRVVPPLKLRVERGMETPPCTLRELAAQIAKQMHERLRIAPAISWLEPGELERSPHKTRFIEVRGK